MGVLINRIQDLSKIEDDISQLRLDDRSLFLSTVKVLNTLGSEDEWYELNVEDFKSSNGNYGFYYVPKFTVNSSPFTALKSQQVEDVGDWWLFKTYNGSNYKYASFIAVSPRADRHLFIGEFNNGVWGGWTQASNNFLRAIPNTDFNTLVPVGTGVSSFYYVPVGGTASVNAPLADTGTDWCVYSFRTQGAMQLAWLGGNNKDSRMWMRRKNSGDDETESSWGAWVEIIHTGNLASQPAITSLNSSVSSLNSSVANKVSKTGDTMTGNLTITSGNLTISRSTAGQTSLRVDRKDTDDSYLARLYVGVTGSTGDTSMRRGISDETPAKDGTAKSWVLYGTGNKNTANTSADIKWYFKGKADEATKADNSTLFNGYSIDLSKENTKDTWVPVLSSGEFQRRVIPIVTPPANGGTGKTTLKDSSAALLNSLTAKSTTAFDNYIIACEPISGTTDMNYFRKPWSSFVTNLITRFTTSTTMTVTIAPAEKFDNHGAIEKFGRVCTLDLNCSFKNSYSAVTKIGAIPAGYRPILKHSVNIQPNTGTTTPYIVIEPNGNVSLGGYTANTGFRALITWVSNE